MLSQAVPLLPGIRCYPQLFADSLGSVAFIFLITPETFALTICRADLTLFQYFSFFFFFVNLGGKNVFSVTIFPEIISRAEILFM